MVRTIGYRARLAALLVAFALIGSMSTTNLVSADPLFDTGTVGVSGTSVPTLDVNFGYSAANFGTTMDPNGTASGSEDITVQVDQGDENNPSAGACYIWTNTITVESNLDYDVTVAATTLDEDLSFVTDAIDNYAECVSGTTLPTTPAHTWLDGEGKGPEKEHTYALTVDVRWNDAPGTISNTVTFTVQQLPEGD